MACYGWDPVWHVSSNAILVADDSGKLRIPGGEEKQIRYDIKNNGALPGSKHNVLAIIEYSISGQHGVFILEESVAVASILSSKKRRMIIAGAGFIVLLFFSRTNNRVSCSGKCCVKIRCCPAGEWRKLCGETGYGSIYQDSLWLELIGQGGKGDILVFARRELAGSIW